MSANRNATSAARRQTRDGALTRNVYFTVALLHVLAEAPFLLRAL